MDEMRQNHRQNYKVWCYMNKNVNYTYNAKKWQTVPKGGHKPVKSPQTCKNESSARKQPLIFEEQACPAEKAKRRCKKF